MTYRQVEMWTVECDRCGADALADNDEYAAFGEQDQGWLVAEDDGWIEHDGKHYCSGCLIWTDDESEQISNPEPHVSGKGRRLMSDPSTLVADLTVTLDRVENVARRATGGPWEREGNGPVIAALGVYVTAPYTDEDHDADLDLIAAFGPDRVLALVAKARKVIDRHGRKYYRSHTGSTVVCGYCNPGLLTAYPCPDLLDEAAAWGVTP